jgi:glycosyltransferase involved in cell wall biosynthesis
MIRVGFAMAESDRSWLGGVNYRANLLRAIVANPNRKIEPVILASPAIPSSFFDSFPPVEIIRASINNGTGRLRYVHEIAKRALGRDPMVERLLRAARIDILSHSGQIGARANLPTIGWIGDFQHRRLPEFVSAAEVAARDRLLGRYCDFCSTILLSSYDAQRDLAEFAPAAIPKSRVLRFVSGLGACCEPNVKESGLDKRYGIEGPFFHLPNQFWVHKNHRLVLEALAILKERGRPEFVIATGDTNDARHPAHFDALLRYAVEFGVEEHFKVLGRVPYADLVALMSGAIAVLNPSLFEGWSTTVEEAKSMGKTVILSAIPVHREQAPEYGVFFPPESAEALADAMAGVADGYSATEDQYRQKTARQVLPERVESFASDYEGIVLETLQRGV